MKIAILSDIHGNLPALEEVMAHILAWQPDQVIVNGDVVNRGPQSRRCWEIIAHQIALHGWLMTRGNHEDFVAAWLDSERVLTETEAQLFASAKWSFEQFEPYMLEIMTELPDAESIFAPDDSELRATHASMLGNQKGIQPWTTDEEIRTKILPPPSVFLTSHTHRFFQRQVDDTLVVNCGSVGVPLDGDVRTGYAQLTWQDGEWSAELIRLEYNRVMAQRHWEQSGFLEAGGQGAIMMHREWFEAQSHFPSWRKTYRDAVHNGEIGADESIEEYLASLPPLDLSK